MAMGPGIRAILVDTRPQLKSISPSVARSTGGTALTLTGYEFHNNSDGTPPTVEIGGFACTNVVVVDGYTITCDSPVASSVGQFDVVVTTPGGVSTLYDAFTLYASTMTAVDPAYANIAGGVDVMITGYNFVTGATITFGGVAVTSSTFIDSEHYLVTIPNHGAGWVDVVMTDPGGAQNTLSHAFQYTLFTRGEDIRRQPGITIQDSLNNQPNTCTATIDGQSNIPIIGEEFEITDEMDGDRLLFRGDVQSITTRYEGQNHQLVYDVQAVDFTFRLNKYRPFGRYQYVSASDIVKDLIARYCPDFTTEFVQTNLAKVSFLFDGTQDMATCLSAIAAQIGGGHWYVDYERRVHFFHVVPAGIFLPTSPQSVVNIDSGTAPTVASGGVITSTFSYRPGWYIFRVTNVYSNNAESVLGPISQPVYLDGRHKIDFSDVAVGAPVGSLTVTKRRIYMTDLWMDSTRTSSIDRIVRFAQVDDNVTTSFTVDGPNGNGFVVNPTSSALVNIPGTEPLPVKSFAQRPAAPAAPTMTIVNGANMWNGGLFEARVSFLYKDGTVSFASAPSNTVRMLLIQGIGILYIDITGIPIGPDVNGVPCVARLIHIWAGNPGSNQEVAVANEFIATASVDWAGARGFTLINGNTATSARLPGSYAPYYADGTYDQSLRAVGQGQTLYYNASQIAAIEPDPIPVWPNPDGPFLEDVDVPDDIDDSNMSLLRDPQVEVYKDNSQIRNKVFVKGRGTVTTAAAAIGATTLLVADGNAFSLNGGKIIIDSLATVPYETVNGDETGYYLTLSEGLPIAVRSGAELANFLELNDLPAQQELGKIERDSDGNVTDGIHEYMIVDPTLRSEFQLYMRAAAELELFARPIIKVRYATRDPKTRSGKTVNINLSNPPIKGEFLIQNVTIDQVHDESDQLMPRYTAEASSTRYELNDLLLAIISKGLSEGGGTVIGVGATAVEEAAASVTGTIQYVTIELTGAQVASINTAATALEIVPAPGDGLTLLPIFVWGHTYEPIAVNETTSAEIRWSKNTGGGGGAANNSIWEFQGFTSGLVTQNRWWKQNAQNDVFFDAQVPSPPTNGGAPVNKSLYLITNQALTGASGIAALRVKIIIAYVLLEDELTLTF